MRQSLFNLSNLGLCVCANSNHRLHGYILVSKRDSKQHLALLSFTFCKKKTIISSCLFMTTGALITVQLNQTETKHTKQKSFPHTFNDLRFFWNTSVISSFFMHVYSPIYILINVLLTVICNSNLYLQRYCLTRILIFFDINIFH